MFPEDHSIAVVGPSGSGKTTLLAIAGLLTTPGEGRREEHMRHTISTTQVAVTVIGLVAVLAAAWMPLSAKAYDDTYVYPYYNECSTYAHVEALHTDADFIFANHYDDLDCAISVASQAWCYTSGG